MENHAFINDGKFFNLIIETKIVITTGRHDATCCGFLPSEIFYCVGSFTAPNGAYVAKRRKANVNSAGCCPGRPTGVGRERKGPGCGCGRREALPRDAASEDT